MLHAAPARRLGHTVLAIACLAALPAFAPAAHASQSSNPAACAPQLQTVPATNGPGQAFDGVWCGPWTATPDSTNPAASTSFGQCTYWGFEMRPDIWTNRSASDPVSDWDAYTWVQHAQQEGLPVSSTPAPGDLVVWSQAQVGNPYGHVAFVSNVIGSTIVIEEMNGHFGTSAGDTEVLTDTPVVAGSISSGWQGLTFIGEPAGTIYTPPAAPSVSMTQGTPLVAASGNGALVSTMTVPDAGSVSVTATPVPATVSPVTTTTSIPAVPVRTKPRRHKHSHHHRRRGSRRHNPRRAAAHSVRRLVHVRLRPQARSTEAPVAFTQTNPAPFDWFSASLSPGLWTVTITYTPTGLFTAPAPQTLSVTIP